IKSDCNLAACAGMEYVGSIRTRHSSRYFLAIPLSALLLFAASIVPSSSFALTVSYKSFNGEEYIDVPDSSALRLTKFTIEVKFRASQEPAERGYIVSKSSSGTGNKLLDQNYALFITPQNKIGGGFKATDGTYQYIYSQVVTTGDWHLLKLIYDGTKLRMVIDGQTVSSRTVQKVPDSSEDGPLRIAANANGEADKFFVGDIDSLKIVDRTTTTFTKVYFNDFEGQTIPDDDGGSGGSGSGDSCSEMPISEVKGTVFIDSVLSRFENDGGPSSPENYVQDSMRYMKSNGMNLIRVPYYWESYVSWPAGFMSELQLIAQSAQDNDICVIFDNHHWYTSSYFAGLDFGKSGTPKGFPSFVLQDYSTTGDYESVAGAFWTDFLDNNITVNGKSIWELQAQFIGKVIAKVDSYKSVTGYEILNEPHLFDPSQYEKLGNYHTYMAKEIRSLTDKKIVFDRETARGFQRDPASEYKVVPQGVTGLVYGPHLYSVPLPGTQGEVQLENFEEWSSEWGVEILLGEWSGESQEEIDAFVNALDDAGFGWTYYKWAPSKSSGDDHLGNVLYESDSSPKTSYLEFLTNAVQNLLS
ncbi:MAG TPA: cellulase family glycosylhydrolase, partial [Nitrososphaera sp.]|nr:cellulase family glycosylhydrolase [Nitrososphaera sp.]